MTLLPHQQQTGFNRTDPSLLEHHRRISFCRRHTGSAGQPSHQVSAWCLSHSTAGPSSRLLLCSACTAITEASVTRTVTSSWQQGKPARSSKCSCSLHVSPWSGCIMAMQAVRHTVRYAGRSYLKQLAGSIRASSAAEVHMPQHRRQLHPQWRRSSCSCCCGCRQLVVGRHCVLAQCCRYCWSATRHSGRAAAPQNWRPHAGAWC